VTNKLEATNDARDRAVPLQFGAAQTDLERYLLALVNHAPGIIFLKDTEYRYLYVNQAYLDNGGWTREKVIGHRDADFMLAEAAATIHTQEVQVMTTRRSLELTETLPFHDGTRHYTSFKFAVLDERGELMGIGGFITDVTARKREEAALLAEQQRVIDDQRDTLRELSTPLLPIAEGVLAVPLVGALGPRRSQELLSSLLRGIGEQRVRIVILDVTGIREIDVEVAASLVTAARAARLLGAEVVLTGISPAVAQTLVAIGTDLSGITTLATLASGISFALNR
jgi:rsbT co-antagonist protein RsbR